MSNFGRDLVGNVNCGTANPLMQMVGQMQGMGAQVREEEEERTEEKGRPKRRGEDSTQARNRINVPLCTYVNFTVCVYFRSPMCVPSA